MKLLNNETIKIHDEGALREASLRLALKQSGLANPPLLDRALTALGEMLIQTGNQLKEHAYHKMTADEASAPTFSAML